MGMGDVIRGGCGEALGGGGEWGEDMPDIIPDIMLTPLGDVGGGDDGGVDDDNTRIRLESPRKTLPMLAIRKERWN